MISTSQAEYLLLEGAFGGRPPVVIGVMLHDPGNERLGVRLRRDWDRIATEDDEEVLELLAGDLEQKMATEPAPDLLHRLEDTLSNAIRISERQPVLMAGFDATLRALYRKYVPATVIPFRTHLPVYSCRAAAGKWGERMDVEPEGWMEVPERLRLTEDMFAAHVTGRSMEPLIPDGALCAFRASVTGSRQGRRLLVEDLSQPDEGARYTVKRYKSTKLETEDGWQHQRVILEPLNPEFESWELTEDGRYRVIAEFVQVLED
ncbi:MAG: DUF3037 domain-containing protein [Bryobacteraceae bacterium]